MRLTNILFKKAKSKEIQVMLQSIVSGHELTAVRERLADKMEVIRFDPMIQTWCIYREARKIKSVKPKVQYSN